MITQQPKRYPSGITCPSQAEKILVWTLDSETVTKIHEVLESGKLYVYMLKKAIGLFEKIPTINRICSGVNNIS